MVAGLLACCLALAGCKQKKQWVEPEPPPLTKLTADPTPTTPAAVESAPAARRPLGGSTSGRRAGDHVSVRWKGSCYAARILSVAGPGAYFITYEGYDHSWDETVGESRICK